jgi:hypothetical protein
MEFTEQELRNWRKFETVRESGVINMYDARNGCAISGLTEKEWLRCMECYSGLRDAYNKLGGEDHA